MNTQYSLHYLICAGIIIAVLVLSLIIIVVIVINVGSKSSWSSSSPSPLPGSFSTSTAYVDWNNEITTFLPVGAHQEEYVELGTNNIN